jgi:hypothetical protein
MDSFDLKKYLTEGKLLKENLSEPKFKEGDKVRFNNPKYKQYSGIIISIEEPTPKGEPTYEIEMDSGRTRKYSFGSIGTFKESDISPFRVTPKEESGGINEVVQYGSEDLVLSTEDGDIEGKIILIEKPLKTNPQFSNWYYFGSLPNNNTPAVQYIKSNIKTKESEGNIVFTLSTFKKWLKKEGIPFVSRFRRS